MKVAETLADRKLAFAQWLFSLQNEAMFEQVEDLMRVLISEQQSQDEIPASHLDSVARGDADTRAGKITSLDDFKAKYARYGV